MSKGFHYIQMPVVIKHKSLPTEEELQSRVRPLQFCSTCRYVLCNCGNCHNTELCKEPCLHEHQEEAADG
jgi:hypothetical protein